MAAPPCGIIAAPARCAGSRTISHYFYWPLGLSHLRRGPDHGLCVAGPLWSPSRPTTRFSPFLRPAFGRGLSAEMRRPKIYDKEVGVLMTSVAANSFMGFCRQIKRQPKTLEYYRWALDHLERLCLELPQDHHPILDVLSCDRLGPESRYDLERALRRFFGWASAEYGIIDPMLRVERTLRKKKLPRFLTRSEIAAVWAACEHDREQALIALFLDTGLRVGEVAGLTRPDVGDFSLRVTGKVGDRQVPITPRARSLLLSIGKGDFCWVSLKRPGRPLSRSGLQQVVRAVLLRAGLSGSKLGPHTLRHTFGTEYCRLGGNPRVLQEIMGHERIETTMGYVNLAGLAVSEDHAKASPFKNLLPED